MSFSYIFFFNFNDVTIIIMSEQSIPVCTLFQDAENKDGAEDAFISPHQSVGSVMIKSNQDSADKAALKSDHKAENQNEQSKNTPTVCNIFQSEPSSEDLFSNIVANSQKQSKNEEIQEVNANVMFDDKEEIEGSGFQTSSHSDEIILEAGIKEEYCQPQASETPFETTKHAAPLSEESQRSEPIKESKDIFGDAPSSVVKVEDLNEPASHNNLENTANTLTTSDLLSSILINDSLDNLSNLSFDHTTNPYESAITTDSEAGIKNNVTDESSVTEAPLPSTAWFSENPINKSESVLTNETVATNNDNNSLQSAENEVTLQEVSASQLTDHISAPTETEPVNQPLTASKLFNSNYESSPFDNFDRSPSTAEDDAFTNALQTSEIDRRRDAWIPNEHTQTILASVAQSQKRIQLEPKFLSRPGLATSESLGDPVKAMLARHKGVSNTSLRKTLTVDTVTNNKIGLQQLIWWHARFALLLRLGLHDIAETEFKQFGSFDSADLFYNFYPDLYPGRRGSMVPFSLRLLHAGFARYQNMPHQSLSRLFTIKSICTQILDNLNSNKSEDGTAVELKEEDKKASAKLWTDRKVKVMLMICNTLLQLQEYHSAITTLDEILQLDPGCALPVHSAIGRMLLQLGDIKAAQERFAQAERSAETEPAHQVQLLSNRAFLYLGANNWKEALKQFDELLRIDSDNIEALNNKAVCLLYLCRLREAIAAQEQAIRLNRKSNDSSSLTLSDEILLEGAISNLVTLYELESSKSNVKKQEILHHVSLHNGDGFNVACLKM